MQHHGLLPAFTRSWGTELEEARLKAHTVLSATQRPQKEILGEHVGLPVMCARSFSASRKKKLLRLVSNLCSLLPTFSQCYFGFTASH